MITIDKIKPQDIENVRKLLKQTWVATYGKYYPEKAIENITTQWHDPSKLLEQSKNPDTYFASAKENDVIIGVITVRQTTDHSLFLSRLYVNPNHQGKGIGSKLMDAAIAYFPGATIFRLECEKQNDKACVFYLKKGFRIMGEKEEILEGVPMTTVAYEKKI